MKRCIASSLEVLSLDLLKNALGAGCRQLCVTSPVAGNTVYSGGRIRFPALQLKEIPINLMPACSVMRLDAVLTTSRLVVPIEEALV